MTRDAAAADRATPSITRGQASFAVALLFGVNFLNYIDRYVIAAVGPLLQKDFGLDDTQLGFIGSMFVVAYMVASPFTGVLGDRWPRRFLVGAGVLLWSLATILSALSGSYHHLLLSRSLIGVGEAGFGVVAPTLISDLFSREARGRVLAFFYVAIPVGSALGFLLGGYVGQHYGWRAAFFIAGAPGILLGLLAFRMREPPRRGRRRGERRPGASLRVEGGPSPPHQPVLRLHHPRPRRHDLRSRGHGLLDADVLLARARPAPRSGQRLFRRHHRGRRPRGHLPGRLAGRLAPQAHRQGVPARVGSGDAPGRTRGLRRPHGHGPDGLSDRALRGRGHGLLEYGSSQRRPRQRRPAGDSRHRDRVVHLRLPPAGRRAFAHPHRSGLGLDGQPGEGPAPEHGRHGRLGSLLPRRRALARTRPRPRPQDGFRPRSRGET